MKLKLTAILFYFDCDSTEYAVKYMETEPGHYNVDVIRNSHSFAHYNTYGSANKTGAKALIERAIKEHGIFPLINN